MNKVISHKNWHPQSVRNQHSHTKIRHALKVIEKNIENKALKKVSILSQIFDKENNSTPKRVSMQNKLYFSHSK